MGQKKYRNEKIYIDSKKIKIKKTKIKIIFFLLLTLFI